ncbi:hypothetical protein C8E17_0203 [Serratia plymuthica]|uniref:Uncharacterized protein n=2 Tax=Serratia plymuthica TaxID=82996 RepID=A0A2X4Y2M8_SERPL|nr:hypothetical protein I6G64_22005 [Serratia plymuthica]QPS57796.1 hypothetical protein I6G53_09990 [Serratia plymuthica]QPS61809.1 hypothetical protein I6G52_17265 [Serratia plymuthica]RKS61098.1 hypothetical protein C8E17_0203 [Serratia plymuthica]CAI1522998.1 Uncharacterised protein [Serratia plymuthica]
MPSPTLMRYFLALCLIVATLNHIIADVKFGFLWDYGYGEQAFLASRLFWGSLTLLDPLVAYFLIVNPRIGLPATLALITVDVIHNGYYVYLNNQWLAPFFLFQCAFLAIAWAFSFRIKKGCPIQAK